MRRMRPLFRAVAITAALASILVLYFTGHIARVGDLVVGLTFGLWVAAMVAVSAQARAARWEGRAVATAPLNRTYVELGGVPVPVASCYSDKRGNLILELPADQEEHGDPV